MSSKMVEVVGSLNMDLVTVTPRMPGPGETLKASSFTTGFGGKGANQAVACARLMSLNSRVKMVGAIGDDQFGKDFQDQLQVEHIDATHVAVKTGMKTGSTVIIVEEETGENRILFTPAANDALKPGDVRLSETPHSLVLLQLEVPLKTVVHTLQVARSRGKETIVNPAPAAELPDEAYAQITHLILNETEASVLSGIQLEKLTKSLNEATAFLLDKGVQTVIITLGAEGVFWRTLSQQRSGQKGEVIAAHKVDHVVDTTGAGDCFVGAWAAYLANHCPTGPSTEEVMRRAIDFANMAASLAVQRRGAQSSMPSLKEVQAM